MDKQAWIEQIDAKMREFGDGVVGIVPEYDQKRLKEMSVKQLALVEDLIARCLSVACAVGCGDCETCKAQNARANARSKRWLRPEEVNHG